MASPGRAGNPTRATVCRRCARPGETRLEGGGPSSPESPAQAEVVAGKSGGKPWRGSCLAPRGGTRRPMAPPPCTRQGPGPHVSPRSERERRGASGSGVGWGSAPAGALAARQGASQCPDRPGHARASALAAWSTRRRERRRRGTATAHGRPGGRGPRGRTARARRGREASGAGGATPGPEPRDEDWRREDERADAAPPCRPVPAVPPSPSHLTPPEVVTGGRGLLHPVLARRTGVV